MRWISLVALVVAATGCMLDGVDLGSKRCPCATGWVCDTARDVCVVGAAPADAGLGRDAGTGGMDAGRDGGADAGRPPDAGAMDGGRSDAGPPDAGPPRDTACDDSLAAASFCDGFEDGPAVAGWSEGPSTRLGIVTWVDDVVFRGRGALRAESTAEGGTAVVSTLLEDGIDGGHLWLRLYVLVPSSAPVQHHDIVSIGNPSATAQLAALAFGTDANPFVWIDESGSSFVSSMLVPRETWTCVEAHLEISGTAGVVELYLDGTLVASGTAIDTDPGESFASLAVGIPWSRSTQPATVVYLDEIAMGPTRLPCDP